MVRSSHLISFYFKEKFGVLARGWQVNCEMFILSNLVKKIIHVFLVLFHTNRSLIR